MKRKHKIVITSLLITVILTGVFFSLPVYLRKTIINGYTGIYDYKIFNNREINTGDPEPWPYSKQYNNFEPAQTSIDSLEILKTTGYLVLKDDSLLYEYYADEDDLTSISNSFSMAKSFVGLLTGCAIEDGLIKGIHQPIDQILTEFNNIKDKGVTIEHLLTMSSGSNWDESYSSPFSITTQAYYGNDLYKLMQGIEIVDKPGVTFRYKSGDTQLLAMILTRVTGKSLAQYASEKLWQPMGAEIPALWSTDRNDGIEKAYCCFNSTARDFARIGSLVLHNGRWKDKQLVPESYIIDSTTPASYLKDDKNKSLTYYGYQWWILNYKGMTIPYARGLQGQYIFIIPSQNAVIVRLGHMRSDIRINDTPIDIYTWVNIGLEILKTY